MQITDELMNRTIVAAIVLVALALLCTGCETTTTYFTGDGESGGITVMEVTF